MNTHILSLLPAEFEHEIESCEIIEENNWKAVIHTECDSSEMCDKCMGVKIFDEQSVHMACSHKSSAVAEMGDRGHNRHGPKRGGCCAPFAECWEPV